MKSQLKIRDHFNIPDDFAYLNCATMGPQPKVSSEISTKYLVGKEQPWKFDTHIFFQMAEDLRAEFAKLMGVGSKNIAIVPSVGYGISLAASLYKKRLEPGNILILDEQFPSNVYPWRALKGFEVKTLTRDLNKDLLAQVLKAIDDQTRIVAIPNVNWSDGHYLDVLSLGKELRSRGIRMLIDGVQSCGVLETPLAEIAPDFYVTGFYKWLLGPYGMGAMYISDEFFDGEPLEQAWANREGAENLRALTQYTDKTRSDAGKFDMGGRSFVNLALATESIKLLNSWGTKALQEHARELTNLIAKSLDSSKFEVISEELRCPHILGVKALNEWPEDTVEQMANRNVSIALRGDRLRISPNGYNTKSDAERLLTALEGLV